MSGLLGEGSGGLGISRCHTRDQDPEKAADPEKTRGSEIADGDPRTPDSAAWGGEAVLSRVVGACCSSRWGGRRTLGAEGSKAVACQDPIQAILLANILNFERNVILPCHLLALKSTQS